MKYYVIDTFTNEIFKGNPAGVCLPESELSDEMMQKIALENNLTETAFLIKKCNQYHLRWFTPEVEMDLCGHATLATAFVLMNFIESNLKTVDFETKSGTLRVTRNKDVYKMDFPRRMPVPIETSPQLEKSLGCKILETHLSRDLLVLVEKETILKNLNPNIALLNQIPIGITSGIIVSAKGDTYDFVSRFFVPNSRIPEDPVTGSAHSTLIPFWSKKLNKTNMIAKQLSPRGGMLICEDLGERVAISGKAVCYLTGEIKL